MVKPRPMKLQFEEAHPDDWDAFNAWTDRLDYFYVSSAATSNPAIGNFQVQGIDLNKDYPILMPGNWVLTPSFDYGGRFLSGPIGNLTNSSLPGKG
mgnify:CR=1 FL=1